MFSDSRKYCVPLCMSHTQGHTINSAQWPKSVIPHPVFELNSLINLALNIDLLKTA
jgi:hypothetical protein